MKNKLLQKILTQELAAEKLRLSNVKSSGRGTLKHLDLLSMKDARIMELFDNLENYTLRDIEGLQQAKWVKQHLTYLKNLLGTEKAQQARYAAGALTPEQIADKMREHSEQPAIEKDIKDSVPEPVKNQFVKTGKKA